MRAQITGLETTQKNAKDGISLVQSAEGALTEVHAMLNRKVELADQSANGTYDNETDRANLQKEVQQLKDEINRIADSANFNGIKLLDGSMDAEGIGGGANMSVNFGSVTAYEAGVSNADPTFSVSLDGLSLKANASSGSLVLNVGGQNITLNFSGATKGSAVSLGSLSLVASSVTLGGIKYDISVSQGSLPFEMASSVVLTAGMTLHPSFEVTVGNATGASIESGLINKGPQVITSGVIGGAEKMATATFEITKDMLANEAKIKIGDQNFTIDYSKSKDEATGTTIVVKDLLTKDGQLDNAAIDEVITRITDAGKGNKLFTIGNNGNNQITLQSKTGLNSATYATLDTADEIKKQVAVNAPTQPGKALTLQIGDTSDSFNRLSVSIQDMHVDSLGIEDLDISTQAGAQSAVDKIKAAINTVSSVRGTLGATQNRLDHTINNLSVMTENIQDAESTIRDTDVADEMMAYTKNNILIQSAQAMLAQANQVPQGVLQLLQ